MPKTYTEKHLHLQWSCKWKKRNKKTVITLHLQIFHWKKNASGFLSNFLTQIINFEVTFSAVPLQHVRLVWQMGLRINKLKFPPGSPLHVQNAYQNMKPCCYINTFYHAPYWSPASFIQRSVTSFICFRQRSDGKTFLASQKCISAKSVTTDCLMGVLGGWIRGCVFVCLFIAEKNVSLSFRKLHIFMTETERHNTCKNAGLLSHCSWNVH